SPSDVKGAWDRIKAEEKAERAARRPPAEAAHLLSSVKTGQPALARAMELQRQASQVGFDWNDPRAVLHKIREEADEIETALDRGDAEALAEETGDLRSEEHTSELQSRVDLVCRLLLEKKKHT